MTSNAPRHSRRAAQLVLDPPTAALDPPSRARARRSGDASTGRAADWPPVGLATVTTTSPLSLPRPRKQRGRERADLRAARVAQVTEPEQILDGAQQREVVVLILVEVAAADER